MALLLVVAAAAGGCKKQKTTKIDASASPSGSPVSTTASSATATAADTSYLPRDIFGPQAVPGATVLKPVDIHSLSESELKFGIAPKHSSAVEYQPDVLIMEQGDKAIRSIASNGLEWRFDARAPQVSDFQEGRIIFATGRAVGRIVSLKKDGDSVSVILGPVQLTDIIKNGKFTMDQAVSAENMMSYVAPDFPHEPDDNPAEKKTANRSGSGEPENQIAKAMVVSRVVRGVWTPMSMSQTYADGHRVTYQRVGKRREAARVSMAGMDPTLLTSPYERVNYLPAPQRPPIIPGTGLRAPQAPIIPNPPLDPAKVASGPPPVVDVGDLRSVAVANPSYIGLQFYSKKLDGGLSIFGEALMNVNGLRLHFSLDIQDGKVVTCGLDLGGALGVKLYMDAHTTKEFQVNLHKKWWEPVDLTIPIGLGNVTGIPFSVTFNMSLSVDSAFSAKQSILHAEGHYTYTGGLWAGYKGGKWQSTTATQLKAQTDMGQSVQGISLGINSLVMASSVRAMVGIGAFGFNTGVYVGMRFDGTILRAPDQAFPCKQGTIEVYIDSGVGYSMPGFVVDLINKLLALFTKYKLERVGTLLKGPSPDRLFHGNTQIPSNCATPK